MDEERLLIEAAQKDPRRFAELYERNFERVYAFIARRVPDRQDAEDVTAQVFQHALANLEFLKQAFAAQEIRRYEWPDGLYASFRIGDSVAGVSESTNHEWMQPMTAMINMRVPNCDAQYEQALRAGAKSIAPVADQPYGVRSGAVEDAWGNQWFFATPL